MWAAAVRQRSSSSIRVHSGGSFIRRILLPSLNVSWALQVSSSDILLRDSRALLQVSSMPAVLATICALQG